MRKIIIFVLLIVTCEVNAYSLSDGYKRAVRDRFHMLLYMRPEIRYVWGAAEPLNSKADCSGYIFWVFHDAGLPVHRTTAIEMRKGLSGWVGKDIPLDQADETDIIWWTWKDKPDRPHGHVGAFFVGQGSNLLEVTHASSNAGHVVIQPITGVLLRDVSAVRTITIGDQPAFKPSVKKTK